MTTPSPWTAVCHGHGPLCHCSQRRGSIENTSFTSSQVDDKYHQQLTNHKTATNFPVDYRFGLPQLNFRFPSRIGLKIKMLRSFFFSRRHLQSDCILAGALSISNDCAFFCRNWGFYWGIIALGTYFGAHPPHRKSPLDSYLYQVIYTFPLCTKFDNNK